MIRRFAFWWFICRDRNKPSGRDWARQLGISHTWLQKLIRKFEQDADEMWRLQVAYGDPTVREDKWQTDWRFWPGQNSVARRSHRRPLDSNQGITKGLPPRGLGGSQSYKGRLASSVLSIVAQGFWPTDSVQLRDIWGAGISMVFRVSR